MHERPGPGQAPGGSRIARWLSWAAWIADFRRYWALLKLHFAFITPLLAVAGLADAVTEMTAPHAGNLAAWALQAGASVAGLLAWVRFVVIPLVARGKLPDGRNLAGVLARRRILRRRARDQRRALREWRRSPRYQPHSHRRPDDLRSPPGEDS